MGLLSMFSKPQQTWLIILIKTDGRRAKSPPQDRLGAIATLQSAFEAGAKVEHVLYGEREITKTALEDLVADAHIVNTLFKRAAEENLQVEILLQRGLDKQQFTTSCEEAQNGVSKMLGITTLAAAQIVLRRSVRIADVFKQQTP